MFTIKYVLKITCVLKSLSGYWRQNDIHLSEDIQNFNFFSRICYEHIYIYIVHI
mgnify:CR=1 FL=1